LIRDEIEPNIEGLVLLDLVSLTVQVWILSVWVCLGSVTFAFADNYTAFID